MNQPNSYAYCHRCHKPVNPANFGYNPQEVTAFHIFYCASCGKILEDLDRQRNPELYATYCRKRNELDNPLPD